MNANKNHLIGCNFTHVQISVVTLSLVMNIILTCIVGQLGLSSLGISINCFPFYLFVLVIALFTAALLLVLLPKGYVAPGIVIQSLLNKISVYYILMLCSYIRIYFLLIISSNFLGLSSYRPYRSFSLSCFFIHNNCSLSDSNVLCVLCAIYFSFQHAFTLIT